MVKNDQPVTTSIDVAKTFGREHKDVMNSIKSIKNEAEKSNKLNDSKRRKNILFLNQMFSEDRYTVKNNNRSYPMYYMNKDGFTLLVMGFNGHKATQFKLQYIAQFNHMADEIKNRNQVSLPRTYSEALRQLAEKVEENEKLKAQLESNRQIELKAPEQLSLSPVLYTTEDVAEYCGFTSARLLNKELNKQRIIYFQKGLWHLYSAYQKRGYKDLSTRRRSQFWTEKGREFIKNKLQTTS